MLQPREIIRVSRTKRRPLKRAPSTSGYALVVAVITIAAVVPLGLTQYVDDSYRVEPTPSLHIGKEVLTTVLIVNNDNSHNNNNDHHGRYLNLRPEIGLLTSTARTFIQEGVTTEYATQVVGTTLENGRLYAQYLKKSSRVLYENPLQQQQWDQGSAASVVFPSVITSWVGESTSLLQSHNDLLNADQPDWGDIDDRLLLERNAFVGNTDFGGFHDRPQHAVHAATVLAVPATTSSTAATVELQALPLNIIGRSGQFDENARKLAANKVLPVGDLPTYTVKHSYAPSGFSWEPHGADAQPREKAFGNIANDITRSPKVFYKELLLQGANEGRATTPIKKATAVPAVRSLATTTYYGFAEFTTTVGDSVIVFSPSTTMPNLANLGQITSITGEATIGKAATNAHVVNMPITVVQDLIEPTITEQVDPAVQPTTTFIPTLATSTATEELSVEAPGTTSSSSGSSSSTTTEQLSEEVFLQSTEAAPVQTSNAAHENTAIDEALGASMVETGPMLSRPTNEEILRIYASLSHAAAVGTVATDEVTLSVTSVGDAATVATVDANVDGTGQLSDGINTELIQSTEEVTTTTTTEITPPPIVEATTIATTIATSATNTSQLEIHGGATTIFFEEDPFANFVEPTATTLSSTQLQTELPITDINVNNNEIASEDLQENTTQITTTTTTTTSQGDLTTLDGEQQPDNVPATTTAPVAVEMTNEPVVGDDTDGEGVGDGEDEDEDVDDEVVDDNEETTTTATTTPAQTEPAPVGAQHAEDAGYKPETAVIVKEISELDASDVDANCIRTSQVFLTQLPKTVTFYTTYLLPDEAEQTTSTSIQTNIVPSFEISQATKHYCIQPTTIGQQQQRTQVEQLATVIERPALSVARGEQTNAAIDAKEANAVEDDTTTKTTTTTTTTVTVTTESAGKQEDQQGGDLSADIEKFIDSSEIDDESDADDSGEEIELIYKTLYTTYTYLTTFFQEDTTSISSHTEVVTNVVTSTLGIDEETIQTASAAPADSDIQPTKTLTHEGQAAPGASKFMVPLELENIIRDGQHAEYDDEDDEDDADDDEEDESDDAATVDEAGKLAGVAPLPVQLAPSEVAAVKTYYTTYTYYTTIFADGETEIMSRTEVFKNIATATRGTQSSVAHSVETTTTTEREGEQVTTAGGASEDVRENVVVDVGVTAAEKEQQYSTMVRQSADSATATTVASVSGATAALPDLDEYAPMVTLVTDVRTSSSNGAQQVINRTPQQPQPQLRQLQHQQQPAAIDDQISSESNTGDGDVDVNNIMPSATLLLQTSFTTFTYYTTMYSGANTNVISRLETITNVVTETLQPTRLAAGYHDDDTTLPITYFTTYTYWTKLAKDGDITTISREETISNVVTPTNLPAAEQDTVVATVQAGGNELGVAIEATTTATTTPLLATAAIDGVVNRFGDSNAEGASADQSNAAPAAVPTTTTTNGQSMRAVALEPTTYYTTYTYYTTSYEVDKTITNSRFETVTNVVTPTITVADGQVTAAAAAATAGGAAPGEVGAETPVGVASVTPALPIETPLLYDYKKIIDADGVSTLHFTTKILPTVGADGSPSEFVSSTSSLYIDEVKRALLPTTTASDATVQQLGADGATSTAARQYKTGLVRLIEGTRIANHTTTLYQSKVIGTFIENRYAQIIESTSSFLFEQLAASVSAPSIVPTGTQAPLLLTDSPTVGLGVHAGAAVDAAVRPTEVQSSINEEHNDGEGDADGESENSEEETDDEENEENGKGRYPFQSRKRTFTPVIRPFASRNRPQFAPKKKNGVASSATIITRSDFTPTITATPALKSTGRFSSSRRSSGLSSGGGGFGGGSSTRRFGRPSKGPAGVNPSQQYSGSSLSSSGGFGSSRNRYSSSSRGSPVSSSRRGGSTQIRPSASPGGFRGSSNAGNARLRIRPTAAFAFGGNQQQSSNDAFGNSPQQSVGDSAEDESVAQDQTTNVEDEEAAEEDAEDNTTENARRNQNPLLRFRRPINRPAGFSPAVSSRPAANNAVSQRRNPLTARARVTTTTSTTTTTARPRPRSFQRPTIGSLQNRARPQNSLFPPRTLLPKTNTLQQQQQESEKAAADDAANDDDSEYEDDEDEEGDAGDDDLNDEDVNRRRRSNNKLKSSQAPAKDPPAAKSARPAALKRSLRVRREADTSVNARTNFRNRFRRPSKLPATAAGSEEHASDAEPATEAPAPHATTSRRGRVAKNGRLNARYNQHASTTTASTTAATTTASHKHRAIRPTRPASGRAQFTLREKDTTTTSTQKSHTRPGGASFPRRPQTSAAARRTTTTGSGSSSTSPSGSRRLKSYSSGNKLSSDSNSHSTANTRSRSSSSSGTGSNARNRATPPARSRTSHHRNDYGANDNNVPAFDGSITVTHVIPAEVTIPVVNGQLTEYKNIITAKTSTEVLSPKQYTTVVGSNGQPVLALTRQESSVNYAGATEITKYLLHETPTTTVTFTPTTIRGRKTSFSHVIPSTVYSVETVVSTVQPQIAANAPLANILLSQLLLGNIGGPLIGGLPGVMAGNVQQLGAQIQPTALATPVTEYRTHTSTYVTTVVEGMSTVVPLTFQGKKILTTVYDTTAQTITATEFITDTIVTTPTQQLQLQQPAVNSLLLQQLLLQQQQQQLQQQQQQQQPLGVLPILNSAPPQLLLGDNLQDLDTNHIRQSYEQIDSDDVPFVEETQTHKTGRKKSRKNGSGTGGSKSGKRKHGHHNNNNNNNNNHNDNDNDNDNFNEPNPLQGQSSVITLYVSGRRPGEFSTILSTVQADYDASTLYKRQAAADDDGGAANWHQTAIVDSYKDFYETDGSELISDYLMPEQQPRQRLRLGQVQLHASQIADNMLEDTSASNERVPLNDSGMRADASAETQTLESIVGDVSLWYAVKTQQQHELKTLHNVLAPVQDESVEIAIVTLSPTTTTTMTTTPRRAASPLAAFLA